MKYLLYLCGFLVALIIGFGIGSHYSTSVHTNEIVKSDTIVFRDTIKDTVPQPFAVYKVRTDTVKDITIIRDTVTDSIAFVIPIETKEYVDTNYRAYVSGYRANLDSIWVFPETRVITNEIVKTKNNKWGLGVQVGAGYNGRKIEPYIGIGINYSIISW